MHIYADTQTQQDLVRRTQTAREEVGEKAPEVKGKTLILTAKGVIVKGAEARANRS